MLRSNPALFNLNLTVSLKRDQVAPPPPSAMDGSSMIPLGKTKFTTELQVRPDDIDLFRHVHSSKYLDYVLAARFDQMERCYGMPMQAFLERGLGWVIKVSHLEYKRALGIAEKCHVTTWIEDIRGSDVEVRFDITKAESKKTACTGWCVFTLISLTTTRPEPIPDDVMAKYTV
jgi:acyl-CoA thioester hydrolase/thioesterase-3